MPNYSDIFALLGAYSRTHLSLRAIAERDLSVTQSGNTLRTLDNLASRFAELLNDSPEERATLDVIPLLQSIGSELSSGWQAVARSLDDTLSTVIADELGVSGDAPSVLAALAREMQADSESLQESSVAIGTPSTSATNIGDGVLIASILRAKSDGSTYESQLVRTQTLEVTCSEDSLLDGVDATFEAWNVRAPSGLQREITTVPVTNTLVEDDTNHVLDASFALWTSSALDAYSLSGAAIVAQETSDALFDSSALNVSGSGQTLLIQEIAPRSGNPLAGRVVALGAWVKVNSITAGNLKIRLRVGASDLSHEIAFDNASATGSWVHFAEVDALPANAYSEGVRVEILTDASFAGDVLIDGLCVTPLEEVGDGVGLSLFAGPTPFVRAPLADRFTVATTNDEAGVFAGFFRDALNVELPVASSPTISDSLAL